MPLHLSSTSHCGYCLPSLRRQLFSLKFTEGFWKNLLEYCLPSLSSLLMSSRKDTFYICDIISEENLLSRHFVFPMVPQERHRNWETVEWNKRNRDAEIITSPDLF